VVVAAILAAGRLIETRLRARPVLLLDDVAAELDVKGKMLLGLALVETGWQVFVTGTEDPFLDVLRSEKTLWWASKGAISGTP
jgi:DNA replication and repair protein RecF